jgi:hypothetical protein
MNSDFLVSTGMLQSESALFIATSLPSEGRKGHEDDEAEVGEEVCKAVGAAL